MTSVPTAAERSGDFSAFLGKQTGVDNLGRPVLEGAIYDLDSTRSDPGKPGSYLKNPFANNIVPANRLSGAAKQVLAKYYPPPNLPVGGALFPNLSFTKPTAVNDDKTGVKIDHQRADEGTQIDQVVPVASVPGKAGRFDAEHRAGQARADRGHQLLETGALHQSGPGATEIVINHCDGGESIRVRRIGQRILTPLALQVVRHLEGSRLAHIDDNLAREVLRRDHNHRQLPLLLTRRSRPRGRPWLPSTVP